MIYWDETTGRKGANEIASINLKYIEDNFVPLTGGEERELVVWSDRCAGQNNNYYLISLNLKLIASHFFTKISQKFLMTGHSYHVCDSQFALIERVMKRQQKFTPLQLRTIMEQSRPSNPFAIIEMQREEFLDFTPLYTFLKKPTTLQVSKCMVIEVSHENLNIIRTKDSHLVGAQWVIHRIGNARQPINIRQMPIINEIRYPEPLELKDSKKKGIKKDFPWLNRREILFYKPFVRVPGDEEEWEALEREREHEIWDYAREYGPDAQNHFFTHPYTREQGESYRICVKCA